MPRRNRPPGADNQGGPSRDGAQPVRVAPGSTTYGDRQKLEEAQRQVPLPSDQERLAAAVESAGQMQRRGSGLRGPSARPREPLTAGMPVGPGPGPETTPPIAGVGNAPPDDVEKIMRFLPAMEAAANRPGASVQTRNIVRRLRSQTPRNYREDLA